jgi:hypothetical protein
MTNSNQDEINSNSERQDSVPPESEGQGSEAAGNDDQASGDKLDSANVNSNGSKEGDPRRRKSDADSLEVVSIDAEGNDGVARHPPSMGTVETEPYNHQKQQEIARRYIAYALVVLIAFLILLSFSYLFALPLNANTKRYVDNLISILQILFGPLITLAATAIGYYFGSNAKESK